MTARWPRRAICAAAAGLLVGLSVSSRAAERIQAPESGAEHSAAGAGADMPDEAPTASGEQLAPQQPRRTSQVLFLEPNELRSLSVDEVSRIAVADPDVVDVTLVSGNELLLQAKKPGSTSIILWDRNGQTTLAVEVIQRISEQVESQLADILSELNLPGVELKRQGGRLLLVGEVPRTEDLSRIEQVLSEFKDQVTNLVNVVEPLPPAPTLEQTVKLTVQLLEMNRSATDTLGVDWLDSLGYTETKFSLIGPGGVDLKSRLAQSFRLGSLDRSALSATLRMAVTSGKARILAEPKLVAASGKRATVFIGVEVPIITASTAVSGAGVQQSVEFKNTGVELEFQPTVQDDGHSIRLMINAKISSIDTSSAITVGTSSVPGFKTRQTQTELITNSGEAVLIAGLLQDEDQKTLSQVPGIGSIPVLGNLFRSTEFVRRKTELVVVVTPELAIEKEMATDRLYALEQALASSEVAASVDDPILRYALQIQERIARSLRYPPRESELGMSGLVRLRLHLFRDGTLGRVVVGESSGLDAFDQEAVKAAESQSPYPGFPRDFKQQDLWVEVPVLFRP